MWLLAKTPKQTNNNKKIVRVKQIAIFYMPLLKKYRCICYLNSSGKLAIQKVEVKELVCFEHLLCARCFTLLPEFSHLLFRCNCMYCFIMYTLQMKKLRLREVRILLKMTLFINGRARIRTQIGLTTKCRPFSHDSLVYIKAWVHGYRVTGEVEFFFVLFVLVLLL